MKQYKINKQQFLEYYFESGQDSENKAIKEDLINVIINQMYKVGFGSYSVQELFNNCNHNAIKLNFIDGFTEDDYDKEFGDLNGKNKITLY